MSFTDDEHADITRAAAASGLSLAAWCAQACLSLMDRHTVATSGVERLLLAELTQARTQAVRIGTNLNQAVHKLNETGRAPDQLARLATSASRTVADLQVRADAAADRLEARR